jgi:hypothetical protein
MNQKRLEVFAPCNACKGLGWAWRLCSAGRGGGSGEHRWTRCTSCRGFGIDIYDVFDKAGFLPKPKPEGAP